MTDLRQTYYSNGYFQSSSNHIPFFLTNTSEFISFTKDLLTFLSLYQRSVPLQSPLAIVTLLTMAVLPSSPTVPHALLLSCTMLQQLWVFLLPRQDNTAPPRSSALAFSWVVDLDPSPISPACVTFIMIFSCSVLQFHL